MFIEFYSHSIIKVFPPVHFKCALLVYASSFADADPLCYPALLTDHIAAPVELAVAAFTPRLLQNIVAPPTAQALTVVHAVAGLVADAALCAGRV